VVVVLVDEDDVDVGLPQLARGADPGEAAAEDDERGLVASVPSGMSPADELRLRADPMAT
jgi:hypothetical protein